MKNIKEALFNTGESAFYDADILKMRSDYAREIQEKVKAGELTRQEATKLLHEFAKKHKHWIKEDNNEQ
ncbi:MAG: hypothetical protein RBR14_06405 [Candidatus Cloacimonas acidaminovorans]|nr:hypothetical protein [Candidatus Cloacimonas acidaminovorans]